MKTNSKVDIITNEEIAYAINSTRHFRVQGNMVNGFTRIDGVPIPNIYPAVYVRRVTHSNFEKARLYCECGREFIIDDALRLEEQDY